MENKTTISPNLNIPGIRLYVEDPKQAIRRQIRRSIIVIFASFLILGLALAIAVLKIKASSAALVLSHQLLASSTQGELAPAAAADWEEIAHNVDKIKAALPAPTDLFGYQGALEQAAQDAGVQISVSFANKGANPSGQQASVEHAVDVKGKIANINQFILNIENLPYYVQITSFKISTSQGQVLDSSANLTLQVITSK